MFSENKAIETAPKAPKLKAPAPKVVVPAPKIVRNGISRPKAGGNCLRVWEIADEITERRGEIAARKEVLERAAKALIPERTASAQYWRWRKFNGISGQLVPKIKPIKIKLPKPPTKKPAGKVGSNKPPIPGSAQLPFVKVERAPAAQA